MKRQIMSFIFILLYSSCSENSNPSISNNVTFNLVYDVNLNWDNEVLRDKTSVNIKWNRWIENDSTNLETIYLFDRSNACRYKIPFKELIQLNNLYQVITRGEIDKYIGDYYNYGNSFHKKIKFDNSLILYIKKALIK